LSHVVAGGGGGIAMEQLSSFNTFRVLQQNKVCCGETAQTPV
jgi:hypothetical protein